MSCYLWSSSCLLDCSCLFVLIKSIILSFFFLLVAVGFPVAIQSVSYFNFSAALRSLRSVDITLCPAAGRDFYVSTLTLKEWEDVSSIRVPVSNL